MSKQPNYVFDDELYHHGILGQRWGHRRFQNEDGSWTPEGRERYGEGGARSKSDVQKYKAKVSYNTQKYKADLKSKAQRDKDKRAAKEERNRIREAEKTARVQKKEQAKTDTKGQVKFKLSKTKNMSDEDLQKAIDRLKLQSEYNKQYTLAKNPDGALAKADRFFSGETGKFVSDLAVKTIPAIATAATKSIVDYNLKKTDSKEIEKKNLEIEKAKVEIENLRKQAPSQQNVNKTQPQPQSITPTQQNVQKSKVQNDKNTKENIKSIVNDTKTISNNVKSTVDTGYRLYKLYTDRVSTKTVSSINTSASVVNSIPKSSLQLSANNIVGYLPATSKVLDERRKK